MIGFEIWFNPKYWAIIPKINIWPRTIRFDWLMFVLELHIPARRHDDIYDSADYSDDLT